MAAKPSTAQKEHGPCFNCGSPILPGETYVRTIRRVTNHANQRGDFFRDGFHWQSIKYHVPKAQCHSETLLPLYDY